MGCIRIFLLAALLASGEARAASSYRVNSGANQDIIEWSTCRNVANGAAHDLMVPTNTGAEWSAFRSNAPPGVTVGDCGPCPAIEFIGAASQAGSVDPLTISIPAGTAVDDVLVAHVVMRATNTGSALPTPAGWTKIGTDLLMGTGGGANSQKGTAYYKVADAADIAAGSVSWDFASASEVAGGIHAYRNVDTAAPVDDSSEMSATTNANSIAATAISTTAARGMIVAFYAINQGYTLTPDTGYTIRHSDSHSNRVSSMGADLLQEASGSTGTVTAALSNNQNRRSARLMGLKQKTTCP